MLNEANVRKAIAMLRQRGFAAIYVNRAGYDDRGAGLEAMLRQLGLSEIIESDRGDLLCVPLPVLSCLGSASTRCVDKPTPFL
mgnify:FL=1